MNVKNVASNAKWIIFCKIAQSLLQLLIGMLSARYLGPANYGLINYAKSVVAFAVPFTQLGFNATLVRELIEDPDKEGQIMGTSLVMSILSSLLCIGSVWLFVTVANRGETQTIIVCVLYSISMMFQAMELIQYWFHSKLRSKYPSMIMLLSYVVVSAYKIFLLIAQKSIFWFAAVYSVEYGVVGILLIFLFCNQSAQPLVFSGKIVLRLLSNSYPYIFSSLMVTLFQNTDHVMLKMISGDTENGYYSAAITSATVCSFVYAAIIDSMRPVILSAKKDGSKEYENHVSTLYCIITYLSIAQGLAFTLLAKPILMILYGVDYLQTVPVLQMLVWYVSFSQMGRIRNIWILAEGKQKILWKINLVGAFINIAINAVLIPHCGAFGAAFASLITQVFTNFYLGFWIKDLRPNNQMLLTGINPRFMMNIIQRMVHSLIRR